MGKIDKSKYTKEEYRSLKRKIQQKKLKRERKNNPIPQPNIIEKPVELPKTSGVTAFVIGNGTSRRGIDIDALINHGIVYGCNALYRNHRPHHLIAVDVKMVMEINREGYNVHNSVWTNYNKAYEKFKNLNYFKPSKGWSSGPTALNLAIENGAKTIYILGFDYKGLNNGSKFNNMYADTNNYKKSTDGATYHGNWLKQTKTVIQQHTKVQFVRVVEPDTFIPEDLKFSNLQTLHKETFINLFN